MENSIGPVHDFYKVPRENSKIVFTHGVGSRHNNMDSLISPSASGKFHGPVVQSVDSLTSSLRVISLTVLADSIYDILIFLLTKCE